MLAYEKNLSTIMPTPNEDWFILNGFLNQGAFYCIKIFRFSYTTLDMLNIKSFTVFVQSV